MDLFARRAWLASEGDQTRPAGIQRREFVSNMEIWAECFGRNPADMRPQDSYAISAMMVQTGSWRRSEKRVCQPIYGRQRVYVRLDK